MVRRGRLELFRDGLLVLYMEGDRLKPTKFMYATGLSWKPAKALLEAFVERKLVRFSRPEGYGRGRWSKVWDHRTDVIYELTMKGKYALQYLDEIIRYVDSSEPEINPPIWALRRLLQIKGIDLVPPGMLSSPTIPELLDMRPEFGEIEKDLKATFSTKQGLLIPDMVVPEVRHHHVPGWLHCPECGKAIPSRSGLKSHISKKHKEKKDQLLKILAAWEK